MFDDRLVRGSTDIIASTTDVVADSDASGQSLVNMLVGASRTLPSISGRQYLVYGLSASYEYSGLPKLVKITDDSTTVLWQGVVTKGVEVEFPAGLTVTSGFFASVANSTSGAVYCEVNAIVK